MVSIVFTTQSYIYMFLLVFFLTLTFFVVRKNINLINGSFEDLQNFLDEYKIIKSFEKNPKFFAWEFKRRKNRPHDSCFVNPEIFIFRRKK